nr:hypothetical protein [Entomoplasma sp. MP1]
MEVKLVHTLNGSGVAIDRLLAAIFGKNGWRETCAASFKLYFNNQEFIQ